MVKSLKENIDESKKKNSYTTHTMLFVDTRVNQNDHYNRDNNNNNNISTFVIYIDLVDLPWSYAIA